MESEYLIVGQGIAGTLVAYELINKGKKVLVIDKGLGNSSSSVAAGVVNPITGRRFMLQSDFNTLREKALQVYSELEELLNINLVNLIPMVRILKGVEELVQWEERKKDPNFLAQLGDSKSAHLISDVLKIDGKSVFINSAFKLNIRNLILSFRKLLKSKDLLLEEAFDFSALEQNAGNYLYKNIQVKRVIFCEGASIIHNPFFNFIPMQPSKGQVLIADFPVRKIPYMINAGLIIVPEKENNRYWIGTANKWNFADEFTEDELEQKLESKLRELLDCDFKVIGSRAAIRPGIKDRMPIMGTHPDHDNLLVFNGLGTKGSSLGPFWANHFVDFLCGEIKELNPKVDVRRFYL